MSAEYFRKRAALQEAAAAEHEKWLRSLSPEERRRVAEMGLDKPSTDSDQVSGHSERVDPSSSSSASTASFDISSLDTYADQLAQRFDLDDATAARLARHIEDRITSVRKQRDSTDLNAVLGMLLRAENV